MQKKQNALGIYLAGCTGVLLLVAVLLRTFLPRLILPKPDAIAVIGVSLTALVLEHYFSHDGCRDFRVLPLYAALIFGLFPWAAAMVSPRDALLLAVMGAVIFTVVTVLFDTLIERLSDTRCAKVAPLLCAFGMYLAAQGLMGIV